MSAKKIGIVSGVGPLAGADVLSKVFKYAALDYKAHQDADYPDAVLLNHGITDVDNTAQATDLFKNEIISMAAEVESMGATTIGIACNTAHIYLPDLPISVQKKTINLPDAVAKEAAQSSVHYLLLTSSTTRSSRLYEPYLKTHGVTFSTASDQIQLMIDRVIDLIMAYKLSEAGELMNTVLQNGPSGFKAIIAGCTELPIAIQAIKDPINYSIVDSNSVLAKALLDSYYQQG